MVETKFRGENKEPSTKRLLAVLDRKYRNLLAQINKVEAERASSDLVVTVLSNDRKNKVNKVTLWSGGIVAGLCISLLATGPVLINAAIYESSVIDWVVENPAWGFVYGIAPLGGILATHSLRDTFASDKYKHILDRIVSFAAISSFAAWAYVFPPVFLPDLSNGYGDAVDPLFTSANWYRLHLGLEFFGGAAIYTSAINKLTHGTTKIHEENEKVSLFDSFSLKLEKRLDEVTKQQSDIVDYHAQFENSLKSYVSETLMKFRALIVVINDYKARGAAVSRTDLDSFLMNFNGDTHV